MKLRQILLEQIGMKLGMAQEKLSRRLVSNMEVYIL